MTDTTPDNTTDTSAQVQPGIVVLAQYIKDFSFENPFAPNSLLPKEKSPEIDININVHAERIGDNEHAVELTLKAQAGKEKDLLFNVELIYGGVFRIENAPEELISALILIDCPRTLFPFARQIISSVTQSGGFPPLMIDPIDFAGLYQEKMKDLQTREKPVANGDGSLAAT